MADWFRFSLGYTFNIHRSAFSDLITNNTFESFLSLFICICGWHGHGTPLRSILDSYSKFNNINVFI